MILPLKELQTLQRAKDLPGCVHDLLFRARHHVSYQNRLRRHGETCITCCVQDTEKVLAITEALWDYFCEQEGLL